MENKPKVAERSFEDILKNALKVGKTLLETLEAENFEEANDMTDKWGKIILSIFAKDWDEAEVVEQDDLVKELLALQETLTNEAERAKEKLSKMRQEQNNKSKAASAYQNTGNTFSE